MGSCYQYNIDKLHVYNFCKKEVQNLVGYLSKAKQSEKIHGSTFQ